MPPEEAFPGQPKELVTLKNGLVIQKIDSIYILQGDIILTEKQVEICNNEFRRSAVVSSGINRWTDNTIYYTFASGFKNQDIVNYAIEEWQNKTSLKFIYGIGKGNYIEFYNGDGNKSNIGMIGGKQKISLVDGGSIIGTAVHEIGHAVGLFHEHTRTDRDNYVKINLANVQSLAKSSFQKYTDLGYSGFNLRQFDFNSVMLYSSYDFAIDKTIPTMTRLDGTTFVAQRFYLASGDVEGVRSIYGPPFHRLEKEMEVLWDDHAGCFKYAYYNAIDFYTDETYTTKAALVYPRTITVTFSESRDYYSFPTKTSYDIIIPAGTTSYSLGETEHWEERDYGSVVRYHFTEYFIQ